MVEMVAIMSFCWKTATHQHAMLESFDFDVILTRTVRQRLKAAVWVPAVPAHGEPAQLHTAWPQEIFAEGVKPVTFRINVLPVCSVGYFQV